MFQLWRQEYLYVWQEKLGDHRLQWKFSEKKHHY